MINKKGQNIPLIILGVVILIFAVGVLGSFFTVDSGQRGVLLTFKKASPISYEPGLHFKWPIVQSVVTMDVQTQKYEVDKASAASKDLQTVTTNVVVNYYLNPNDVPDIFVNLGVGFEDRIIQPAVLEVIKASTADYTAEELITKRPEVKTKIDMALTDRLKSYGINVRDISITNFDFSPEFNTAIEQKVTAQQNALAAKNKLEQIQYEAQQRVTTATAEAQAIQIQAAAIQSQGGRDYVQLQAIGKWDGHLPTYTGGAMPFINVAPATTTTAAA
jgi:regulator of protease activity HflC (stomatin/prohibitin superfamily)